MVTVGAATFTNPGKNSTSEVYIRNMFDAWVGYMGAAGAQNRGRPESVPA